MWFHWIRLQVVKRLRYEMFMHGTAKVNVICRTKDGREFDPFSIEWRGTTLILCENEEPDDG